MTALVWDAVGDRRYEVGIDRGVLYLPTGEAIPWNGLTEVAEAKTREIKSYYLDGVKYLDRHVPGAYAARLKAFTYPDELEELLGNPEFAPGVTVYDQRAKYFNLCYRTGIGNDVDPDAGHRIHVIYNVTASAADTSATTVADTVTPQAFEWDLVGTPQLLYGLRPTSHISINTMRLDPVVLAEVEDTLYGTEETEAILPDFLDLLNMMGANP